MTRKTLEDCRTLALSIEAQEERIARLRSLAERITAVLSQNEGHGGGGAHDKMGEQIAELEELHWQLGESKVRFRNLARQIRAWASGFDTREQALIRFRYIEALPWPTVGMLAGYEGRQYEYANMKILKTIPVK